MLDEIRNGVRITLKGDENQTISGFVKNISSSGEPGTYIGGRMLGINQKDNRLLTNFIKELQQVYLEAIAA